MNPLICFYKNEESIYSTDYERIQCDNNIDLISFLNDINKRFFHDLKVIQINFEAHHNQLFLKQKSLYPNAKATVFILNKYQTLPLLKIKLSLMNIPKTNIQKLNFKSLIQKEEFIHKVELIKNDISNGRIYQMNLTSPLLAKSDNKAVDIFYDYENFFSGKYKCLIPLDNTTLLSFSPELYLEKSNNLLITCPIKGSHNTQPLSKSFLLNSEKEEAELSMIVDLLRNDLNSLSYEHHSHVNKHRAIMDLGYIQHTYSEIQVHTESSLPHVINNTFPGGSITGCPKLESLKVIAEVEEYRRQAYTGCIGWWKDNDFSLNITIRTLIQFEDNYIYNSGCGIIYDSDPISEWNEFILKTGSLNVTK